ncbi:unnamed protein product [Phytophthora lilii]|uniref:Unnamed protein product n=1 Tax=Phytophthora lilii TaxID=2077276 RepID=A0A9W6TJD3_9STRA|nr:unnamed protein product [Phytophthora lilii]
MGKSDERNVTAEEEFSKLEQVLNQTADDVSNCLKLLKKHLSDYDSRNGNHFINTATSYMRSDMRTAKDTAMDLKHVAHKINKGHKPSKTEVSSARNMMDATEKAMDTLKATARNYDRENGQSMGVMGTVDAAVGGSHHKEKDEKHGGLFGKEDKKEDEKHGSLFGKDEKENKGGVMGKDGNVQHGLLGKSDQKQDEHRGGLFRNPDNNVGGIIGSTDTVETIVKKTLRDNFSLSALSHQIAAAEKSLSPSIVERAKEAMHEVKDKLKGDKHSEGPHHQGHHVKYTTTP